MPIIFHIRWAVHLCPNCIILVIIPVWFWFTYTSGPLSHTFFTIVSHITTYLGSFCHTVYITVGYVCYMFRVSEYQRWIPKTFTCLYICPWVSRFYRVTLSVIIIWVWVLCTSGLSPSSDMYLTLISALFHRQIFSVLLYLSSIKVCFPHLVVTFSTTSTASPVSSHTNKPFWMLHEEFSCLFILKINNWTNKNIKTITVLLMSFWMLLDKCF